MFSALGNMIKDTIKTTKKYSEKFIDPNSSESATTTTTTTTTTGQAEQ